ncbi:VanZ family protein [Thalassobacillus devorans]|uniref:VanZ family protein n=1 Tax=Thalassobacillus devorans TaxID=279813 RepID=UPI00111BE022|nr:VanZ family protein [Thalassobacillus devorans]
MLFWLALMLERVMGMWLDVHMLFGMDKQMHFFAYSVVSLLVGVMVVLISGRHVGKRNLSYAWMVLVAVGTLEEYRQYFVPNRSAEFLDAIANLVGVSAGLAVPLVFYNIMQKKIHVKPFVIYHIVLIPLLLGLLYLNERPFVTFDAPVQERVERFVAFIGLE